MKLEIADITNDSKHLLKGFKVLGVFPFYLKYIKVSTHVDLCRIKEQIKLISPKEASLADFENAELQAKIMPLILDFCRIALVNNRSFSWFFNLVLGQKLKSCGHWHILNIYLTIFKLNDPSFFLMYWKHLKTQENTLLKEAEPS